VPEEVDMRETSKLTFTIFDGECATPEYSCVEISPVIDGFPLADMLGNAIKTWPCKERRETPPGLECRLPYLDIADYMKQERSYKKRLFHCADYDCDYGCDMTANIRHKGGSVVMDQFVYHCYNFIENQSVESSLDIKPFTFEKDEYIEELERVKRVVTAKELTDKLVLPTALMKVYHNDNEASFFVRSTRKNTWIYPDDDESQEYEAFADECLYVIIPLEDKEPGDKILVCFDNIKWEHESSDEEIIIYDGYNEGFHYGICIPDEESSEKSDGKSAVSFLVETMMLEEFPDLYLFHDIQFEIVKCKKRDKSDYIILTIAWCSEEREHAARIATSVL